MEVALVAMHAKVPLTPPKSTSFLQLSSTGKKERKRKEIKKTKEKKISRTSEAQKGNLVLSYQSDQERFFLTLAWLCCFFSNTKKKAHFKNRPL